MKMLKKTLALLLAAAIAMSIGGTFVFAETTTPLTAFPSAPDTADGTDFSDYYVYMQNESDVISNIVDSDDDGTVDGVYIINSSGTLSTTKSAWGTPRNYTRGLHVQSETLTFGNHTRVIGDTTEASRWFFARPSKNTTTRWKSPTAENLNLGANIALEGTEDNSTTTVSSDSTDYLMIHTDKIIIEPLEASDGDIRYSGFGLATQSELISDSEDVQAWAYVGTSSADNGKLTLRVKDDTVTGSIDQTFDLSDWVTTNEIFDMKLLVNLKSKTYDVYINNCPVATSIKYNNENGNVASIALCLREGSTGASDNSPTMGFGTTKCYAMTELEAAQYKQAVMERVFAREFDATENTTLFYTRENSADYNKLCGTDATAYRSFKCEGSDFAITSEAVGETSYKKVYYTADASYDYDNLEGVYVSAPAVVDNTAKVSGTYQLFGGKGAAFKPVVLTALYEEATRETLVEVKCTESTGTMNGTYGGEEFLPDNNLDNPGASAFIWGGKSLLVPLFGRVDFN